VLIDLYILSIFVLNLYRTFFQHFQPNEEDSHQQGNQTVLSGSECPETSSDQVSSHCVGTTLLEM
jgi:hypothetical protein